jgi:hypothetical protein
MAIGNAQYSGSNTLDIERELNFINNGVPSSSTPKGYIILPADTRPTPEQVNYLNSKFGKSNWSPLNIPEGGWTLSAMREITRNLKGSSGVAIFATPVDILMRLFVIHGVSMVMFEEALFG